MAKSRLPLVLLAVVFHALNCPRTGHGVELSESGNKLQFEDIKKQFPLSDLETFNGRRAKDFLPKQDSVKNITVKVAQLTGDKKEIWLQTFNVVQEDFPKFYDFVAYSVPVLNESEFDIVAYLELETLNGGQYNGLILNNVEREPVLYAFRDPDRDKTWFHFATTHSKGEVVKFLKSLDREESNKK